MDMLKTYGAHRLAEMTYRDILKRREKKNREKKRMVDSALQTMFTCTLATRGRKLGQCAKY